MHLLKESKKKRLNGIGLTVEIKEKETLQERFFKNLHLSGVQLHTLSRTAVSLNINTPEYEESEFLYICCNLSEIVLL